MAAQMDGNFAAKSVEKRNNHTTHSTMMTTEQLKEMLYKVTEQNPEGFTYSPSRACFLTRGYVVASNETQDCFGKAGIFKVIKFYLKHTDYCIGGWRNEDGTLQFDASKVYQNIHEAISAALANGQRAIYNLYTKKEIMASDYANYSSCSTAA